MLERVLEELEVVRRQVFRIRHQGVKLMEQAADLLKELQSANEVTNEIADDLDQLIDKQVAGGITDAEATQIKTAIQEHVSQLREVAAKYTPEAGPAGGTTSGDTTSGPAASRRR